MDTTSEYSVSTIKREIYHYVIMVEVDASDVGAVLSQEFSKMAGYIPVYSYLRNLLRQNKIFTLVSVNC